MRLERKKERRKRKLRRHDEWLRERRKREREGSKIREKMMEEGNWGVGVREKIILPAEGRWR